MSTDHQTIAWMASWSGGAIMKYHVHDCGRSAYEVVICHRVKHVVAGFWEHVLFNMTKDTAQQHVMDNGPRDIVQES